MQSSRMVVFTLGDRSLGLPLASVERVVRAVEVTALPKAPEIVTGVINVQGRVIPVVSLRRRFGLVERDLALTDQMVIAWSGRRSIVLVVDSVEDVVEVGTGQLVQMEAILADLPHVAGIAKLPDGLIVIQDLDRFLSLEEEADLDRAMKENS